MEKVNEVMPVNVTGKMEDWEVKREQRLDRAARELVDEIWPIKDKLEKACLILQELTDEYFRKYTRGDKDYHTAITWEFSRNATFADIIDDYVYQAKNALGDLEARADRATKEVRDVEKTSH